MKFDRMGRRVEYIEREGETTLKHQKFVYDGYLCIQRLNGVNNSVTDLFEWDPTERVATRPLYWQPRTAEGNFSLFYTHDGNKNVSEVVFYQRARGVAAHYEYAPFGEVTVQTRGNAWGSLDLSSINPWRFSSEYYDKSIACIEYNYRCYDIGYGRFIVRDSLTEDMYVVASNAPTLCADVLGLIGVATYTKERKMQRFLVRAQKVVCDWVYDKDAQQCKCLSGTCRWEDVGEPVEREYELVSLINIYSAGLTAEEIATGIAGEIGAYLGDKAKDAAYQLAFKKITGKRMPNIPLYDEIMALANSNYLPYLGGAIEYEGRYYLSHTTQRSYSDAQGRPLPSHMVVPSCDSVGRIESIASEVGKYRWEKVEGI